MKPSTPIRRNDQPLRTFHNVRLSFGTLTGVAPVAEEIAEPLHVGKVVLETSALQKGPFGPTSGSSGLLAGAPLPEVRLESCTRPLQGKLSLNLVEIERQRAAVRSFCIPGELREEAFKGRVGQQESAISEARVDPCARVVKSVDVNDVARDAEAKSEFVPRGFGEAYE